MNVPVVKAKITMCLGVTEFLPDDTTDAAIKRADEAMYMAKRAGRNQVVVI